MAGAPFIADYFGAEKQESLLFMAVGVAACLVSFWLWRKRSPLRGMSGPLMAIAAIQIVVGASVYFRTDAQVAALQAQRQTAPSAFQADESARMAVVIRKFELYKRIEIALLVLGGALTVALRRQPFWFAFGLGLALQAGFMLALDLFAESRAHDYLRAVASS